MRYVYPCFILPDEEDKELTGRDSYNVSFPDVPPALTCGDSWTEAVEMAIDALEVALSFYIDARKDIPKASPASDGQVMIPVPPLAAAKLSLYTAMRKQGISEADLAARMEVSEEEVRRMVSLSYRTRIRQVEIALLAIGRAVVTEDMELEVSPPGLPEFVVSEAGALG